MPAEGYPTTVFVAASTLNLRGSASADAPRLARLAKGERLRVLTAGTGWVQVETSSGRQRGWVLAKYVTDRRPGLSVAKVRRILIERSVEAYPGPCACPYNTDRIGRSCGARSAWSKAGGYAPLCYPADVSADAVEAYLSAYQAGQDD